MEEKTTKNIKSSPSCSPPPPLQLPKRLPPSFPSQTPALQYYRDAAQATLSMEAPRNIASKTSTSPGKKVEMGQGVSGPEKTPDKQAQSDVMKQKVTELLMMLSIREQEVRSHTCVFFFSRIDRALADWPMKRRESQCG